jgi:hypothetical protein
MATSAADNKHRIAVNARVRDNSGGTAYAFALDSPPVNSAQLKTKIKLGQLTTANHMVELGTFGADFTDVSGNVEHFFVFTELNADTQAPLYDLVDFDSTTGAGQYHVYLYVRDIFNNMVIQPHPSNPIQMRSDTIQVAAEFDAYFLSTDASNQREFAEYRAGASNPQVTQKNTHDVFDFYNARTDKLYANVTIDTHESVVNNVRLVAFSTSYDDLSNAAHVNGIAGFVASTEVYNDNTDNLFDEDAYDAMGEKAIEKVFTGYDDTSAGSALVFGNVYHVYSVVQDIGFGKPVVRLLKTVSTGAAPVLSGLSASIAETF